MPWISMGSKGFPCFVKGKAFIETEKYQFDVSISTGPKGAYTQE